MSSFFRSRRFFLAALIFSALGIEFAMLYYFLIIVPQKKAPPPIKPVSKYLIKLKKEQTPSFSFPREEFEKLEGAFQKEKEFLSTKIIHNKDLPFGEKKISVGLIKESAQLFFETIKEAKNQKELNRLITERFTIYQAAGAKEEGDVLFTGYYSPVYEGALQKHGPYQYPLYVRPEGLKVADLGKFDTSLEGERIVYRINFSKKEITPYWTRKDIVENEVLLGKDLELVYLKDRLDRFYLMIEGSGKITLENGESFWVRWAASNDRPYTSLGRLLVKEGKIPWEKLSMQSIREYFKKHPQNMNRYLNQNDTFIFFSKDDREHTGAIGAAGCVLTPQVSIAIDKKIFPLGALAYIEYPEPQINNEDEVVDIKKKTRFVFCQDTGGVIKGSGRVDVYFGEGKQALARAGRVKGEGKLYFLIKKE